MERFQLDYQTLLATEADAHAEMPVDCVVVTSEGTDMHDPQDTDPHFRSRVFAPWIGINEDPGNLIAHLTLAPYWGRALRTVSLHAVQCSPRLATLFLELETSK